MPAAPVRLSWRWVIFLAVSAAVGSLNVSCVDTVNQRHLDMLSKRNRAKYQPQTGCNKISFVKKPVAWSQ